MPMPHKLPSIPKAPAKAPPANYAFKSKDPSVIADWKKDPKTTGGTLVLTGHGVCHIAYCDAHLVATGTTAAGITLSAGALPRSVELRGQCTATINSIGSKAAPASLTTRNNTVAHVGTLFGNLIATSNSRPHIGDCIHGDSTVRGNAIASINSINGGTSRTQDDGTTKIKGIVKGSVYVSGNGRFSAKTVTKSFWVTGGAAATVEYTTPKTVSFASDNACMHVAGNIAGMGVYQGDSIVTCATTDGDNCRSLENSTLVVRTKTATQVRTKPATQGIKPKTATQVRTKTATQGIKP